MRWHPRLSIHFLQILFLFQNVKNEKLRERAKDLNEHADDLKREAAETKRNFGRVI